MPEIQYDAVTKIYPVTKSDYKKKTKGELARLAENESSESDPQKKIALAAAQEKLQQSLKKPSAEQLRAQILNDFSLSIADGEFTVFVGPSGCGKSTALRILAGLEEASTGNIKIGGKIVNDTPSRDRDIAFVFQSYALYPHMSVFDNIAFGLKLRKLPDAIIQKKTRDAAELLQLSEHLHKKPRQLSGGQRQRVAMGRALVREASIFLFDEPLSNLDAQLRQEMRAQIKKLTKKLQTTSVYVTHDQIEAMTLADKIVVLNRISGADEKNIRQIASPAQVYDNPADVFTAKFIGTPQINIFNAEIESAENSLRIKSESINAGLADKHIRQIKLAGVSQVLVGIRPHDITLAMNEAEADIEGTCEISEFLGHEAHLHVRVGANVLRVVLQQTVPPAAGSNIRLKISTEKLVLFHPQTEKNLFY